MYNHIETSNNTILCKRQKVSKQKNKKNLFIAKIIYIQNNNLLKPPTSYTIITFRNMNHIYGGAIYWRFMKLNTFNKTEINVKPIKRDEFLFLSIFIG